MRLITDNDVAALLTMREAIGAMAAAFVQFGNGVSAIVPRVRAAAEHRQEVADRRAGDIVVYKSVDIGLEDVALAHLVYQRCG